MLKSSIRHTIAAGALTMCFAATSSNNASAANIAKGASPMSFNASIGLLATLNQLKAENKPVELHLRNGKSFKGVVSEVGDNFVVLGKLAGRDFYSALIRIESIDAVEAQTAR